MARHGDRIEAAAIERAAARLDRESVEKALEIIASCGGKIIVTGVGKSGVIGQKIAQTMTSTGTWRLLPRRARSMCQ